MAILRKNLTQSVALNVEIHSDTLSHIKIMVTSTKTGSADVETALHASHQGTKLHIFPYPTGLPQ